MKKGMLFLILLFCGVGLMGREKMKLYTFYTPSHDVLRKDWFLPSIKDDFDVVVKYFDQQCESANFQGEGWNNTMLNKVNLLIEATHDNWGGIFIYADIDIRFIAPIENLIYQLIQDKDIVVQRNNPQGELCAGFFACRANEKTLQLWQSIKALMMNEQKRDQQALNILLRKNNFIGIAWDYLPVTFFGGGILTGARWNPGDYLYVPQHIVLHHANYVVGVAAKIAQFEYVRDSLTAF